MAKTQQLFLILLVFVATACVPMEQASLTYTSKTTLGVGVAAGTQETPGLEVTIGFKETNVAFVPVAVAKYCYKATAAQCQDLIYEMKLITGGKLDAVEGFPIEKRISEINQELSSLMDQQKRETDRLGELRSQIALSEAADAASTDLVNLGQNVEGESEEIQSRRAKLAEKVSLRPGGFNVKQSRSDVAQLEAAQLGRIDIQDSQMV